MNWHKREPYMYQSSKKFYFSYCHVKIHVRTKNNLKEIQLVEHNLLGVSLSMHECSLLDLRP